MNLNQITIPVTDIERSIISYQKPGLTLIVKALPEYARFVCGDGQTTFSLHRVDKLATGEGAWVYFETENFDEHVNAL